MLLICLLTCLMAVAIILDKESSTIEQEEFIPIPVRTRKKQNPNKFR